MAHTCYTAKLLKLTRNKQEAIAMLNVFMNVMCRFGHGFKNTFFFSIINKKGVDKKGSGRGRETSFFFYWAISHYFMSFCICHLGVC